MLCMFVRKHTVDGWVAMYMIRKRKFEKWNHVWAGVWELGSSDGVAQGARYVHAAVWYMMCSVV